MKAQHLAIPSHCHGQQWQSIGNLLFKLIQLDVERWSLILENFKSLTVKHRLLLGDELAVTIWYVHA
jgi:hypothetical protein